MNELTLHPNIYSTGDSKGLVSILERLWVREFVPGEGSMYIISGFANYNGGVRFFPTFTRHIDAGGRIIAVFGGSTSQRLTSIQIVEELLKCGIELYIINRKRLMHAKSYGVNNRDGQRLVVTSGNFTGPGMSQNVEMSLLLDQPTTDGLGFSWEEVIDKMLSQRWDIYQPSLDDRSGPAWSLLYDEKARGITLDETDEITMVIRLGHADTVRINALPGSVEGKGSQYFWLSKDCYDFFPALTIPNSRGIKKTYSCLINIRFVDLNNRVEECRVTFEADNNLDFRLGTGPLRNTRVAQEGDLAAISRIGDTDYELRIFKPNEKIFTILNQYAVNFIGHQGKQYGFLSNQDFEENIGTRIGHRLPN